VFIFLNSIN